MSVVKFKVKRFDPAVDKKAYYSEYEVPMTEGLTILEAILHILENHDGSLSARYACRGGICGSDAILINGKYGLACEVQVKDIENPVTLEPLPFFPVIKDLVVDMDPFFEKYLAVKPYLIVNDREALEGKKESLQSPSDREKFDEATRCILCGACYSSCVSVWTDGNYLGPAALLKAQRYVADSRDEGRKERLNMLNSEDSVWRCHTAFNCVEACPKELNPTEAIQELKRSITWLKIKSLFGA